MERGVFVSAGRRAARQAGGQIEQNRLEEATNCFLLAGGAFGCAESSHRHGIAPMTETTGFDLTLVKNPALFSSSVMVKIVEFTAQ